MKTLHSHTRTDLCFLHRFFHGVALHHALCRFLQPGQCPFRHWSGENDESSFGYPKKGRKKKVELHLQSELNLWLILWHPFARSRSSSDHHVYRRSRSTNEAAQSQIENQSTATWISRLQSTIVATFPNFSVKRWFYQLPYQRQDALRRNSAAPAIPPGQQTPGRSALGCGVFFKILDPAPSVVGHCGY